MAKDMKLFLELDAKTRGLVQGMANSKSAVSKFARGAKRELKSLQDMSTSIQGKLAAMGLSLGAGKIMLDSARLDKTLTQIGQTAGVGEDQVGGLRKELFGLGRESGQQIENLRDGFNNLVQSGLGMKESKETLDGINIAMAVTGSSAETLSSGLTVAAKAYNFDLAKPGKALEMLDRMTVAGRLGNAELEDLSSIFARVGVNASTAGMGFGKTLAFIEGLSLVEKNPERLATLADSTLRVFTNMRYMASAQKSTKVKFFDADGSRRDAMAVLADIKKKYDTLTTDKARANFIQRAFGKADLDTIKGIRTLLSGDALDKVGRFTENIAKAGGTLRHDFSAATANLIDQAGMLKNDLRQAADGFVQPINETMGKFIQFMRDTKANGGLGLDGKDMIFGGAAVLGGTALAARYGGKAVSGIARRFLKGGGSLAMGVAQGKALEAATGVNPVFVTNWPGNMGSGLPGGDSLMQGLRKSLPAPAKTPFLKNLGSILKSPVGMGVGSASMLTTAGGVVAAGAGGYALGTGINELGGIIASKMTGGKYGGSGWLGEMIYDAIHGGEKETVNKTNLTVYVDKNDRVTTKSDNMNNTIDATFSRGAFA